MNDFTSLLWAKDVEIYRRLALIKKEKSQWPGTNILNKEEIDRLKAENARLVDN